VVYPEFFDENFDYLTLPLNFLLSGLFGCDEKRGFLKLK
jgi:hypothetical protein